jgi:hypothetical protein
MQGAAFSPDSRLIATLSSEGVVHLFKWERFAPIEQLVALAARRVKRNLTPREREIYLHETPQ